MNVIDSNEPAEKKRRIVYDSANLHCALTNQSNDFLETLKHNDVYLTIDLTCTDENGNTALHLIFKQFEESDVLQILEIFFEQGVDLNIENGKNETALHLAVGRRMRSAIDLLIQHKADINKRDTAGNAITHYFIEDEYEKFLAISELDDVNFGLKQKDVTESDSAKFVEWLISRGFDFGACNNYKWSALHMAIERNLQHILPTLVSLTNDIDYVDERGRTLLHLFLQMNDKYRRGGAPGAPLFGIWSVGFTRRYAVQVLRFLLERGVSVDSIDKSGDTVLHVAVRNKEDMEMVELLLQYFTKVHHRNNFGDTVFHEAIRNASSKFSSKASYFLEISRALLKKGADPNIGDRYGVAPVYYTVSEKKLPAIQLMKEYHADFGYVSKANQNLLHLLAFKHVNDKRSDKSWETMFDLLISENCMDINKSDKRGQSPLHLAIKHNNLAIVRKLIENGADVNRKNADGARPLDRVGAMAKIGDGHAALRMLLKHGAHVNARDIHGETALSHALSIRSTANVEELLKHGADINEAFFLDLVVLHHDLDDNPALDCILRHYLKLKAAGMWYSKEYDTLIDTQEDYVRFYEECLAEIDVLKNCVIDARLSIYEWLRMSPNGKCCHVNNEMLKSIVESNKLEQKFPKYFVVILGAYREMKMRKSVMEPAKIAWRAVTKIDYLPDACVERILDHLDNADLLSLSEDR